MEVLLEKDLDEDAGPALQDPDPEAGRFSRFLFGAQDDSDSGTIKTLAALSLLMLIGFTIFICGVIEYTRVGVLNQDYYAPGPDMWGGLLVFWFCVHCLLFWRLLGPKESREWKYPCLWLYSLWVCKGLLFVICGLICMTSYATQKGFRSVSFIFITWIAAGSLVTRLSILRLQVLKQADGSRHTRSYSDAFRRCCCSLRTWTLVLLVLLWQAWGVFTIGSTVQACGSARDLSRYPPVGKMYDLHVDGMGIRVHLYCQGQSWLGRPTVLFEHGGGANSISVKAMADSLSSNYATRTCIYDRLGYGWTPSYFTSQSTLKGVSNSGTVLRHLLQASGEQGPFLCVGHSAGASSCISFTMAMHGRDVIGIVMLDGYPDIIRAGSYRPGPLTNHTNVGYIGTIAALLGPTGLTRGLVGQTNSHFTPAEMAEANAALYSQTRFWFSQYWDLVADAKSGQEGYLFLQLQGSMDGRGVVTYGKVWNETKVVHMPASHTVDTTCSANYSFNDFCCGNGNITQLCKDKIHDAGIYLEQAEKYVSTLSAIPGSVVVAPRGSEHGFCADDRYLDW
eukprot:CAMPEP_0184307976 /NCGR_PEP_ID=MMETSP1049-20130417/16565_1 /TAXON_ID=77928 /ORGANISM="Proteomonas sulcata, Strain CCMP704" /LENGTH=563 /DNA_ID=CAMNT_0026620581 /DNA_START=54 /DNA_END=1742 /DNA_ORIENTATION=+